MAYYICTYDTYKCTYMMYFLTILIKAATRLSCSIILRVWISHVVGAVELAKEPRVAVAVVHAHLGRKKI